MPRNLIQCSSMEINGLPLHALVIHGAVVFGPLSALTGVAFAVLPKWRERLRWPLVVLTLIGVGAIWVAYLTGEDLVEGNTYGGPLAELLETHEDRAGILRIAASGFGVLALAAAWSHTRSGVLRQVMAAFAGIAGIVTVVYVVLVGDAGAQIAWYGVG